MYTMMDTRTKWYEEAEVEKEKFDSASISIGLDSFSPSYFIYLSMSTDFLRSNPSTVVDVAIERVF